MKKTRRKVAKYLRDLANLIDVPMSPIDSKETDNEIPSQKSKSNEDIKSLKDEFERVSRKFEFLYESTFQINSENEIDKIVYLISEWEVRIRYNDCPELIRKWNNIIKKNFNVDWYRDIKVEETNKIKKVLLEWFDFLQKNGIKRDNRKEITIYDNELHHIYVIDELWKIGDKIIIESPAWFYKEKYIERGKARLIK